MKRRVKKEKDEAVIDSFVEQTNKSKQMLAAMTLYRHQRELQIVEEEMDEKKPVPTQNDNKVKRAIIDGTVNAYRRKETQRLSEKKKLCQDHITAFQNKCKEEGIELGDVSEESLRALVASTFAGDTYGLQRICFAMFLCLQGEEEGEEFVFGKDTLEDVSTVLFDDENRIGHIEDKFYEHFKELTGGSFWERNKYLLIGAGISFVLVGVLAPLVLGLHATGSAIITSCLAQIGRSMPGIIGTGIAKVTSMAVLGSTVFGGVALAGIGVKELIRAKHTKETFRQLKPNDVAALFAMKATLIDFGMALMDKDKCKEELDACLANLNDFRADAEYMLIVEKSDAENSKKKIQICNRFVDRLALIAGI